MALPTTDPPALPTGTVTFLFTDIEGSTKLLQQLGDRYTDVLAAHHAILAEAVEGSNGHRVATEGDALFAVFEGAPDAVRAAVEAQRALAAHAWTHGRPIRVRMGLHTGEGQLSTTNYVGLDVHRAARIASAGHGGQVVLSEATQVLVHHTLPEGVSLQDLGEHRLKDIEKPEHLFQLVIAELPSEFPPLRTLDAKPNNLPTLMTSFVGRERDVAAVKELLGAARLLTLTGPGGTGKTRLSLEVAADLLPQFPGGVFFVRLAPIRDPALIPSTIAQAIGIQQSSDRPMLEVVKEYLQDKELLLVLDNFEQLISGAPMVGEILAGAPGLKALVSSREVLHVSGEQEYPVPPLELPDPHALPDLETLSKYDALVLFVQRARAVDPSFGLNDQNAAAVAEICARLDGLPLAIELATARLKLLSPQAILQRLERRLPLLKGGARDLPERQQTLQNAIAWSYDLLDPHEQGVFKRLGIFLGGWQLRAVEAIVGEDVDLLDDMASLVDKSLIRQSTDAGVEPRFWMLETIREYAADRLEESGEREDLARRHAEFFLSLAEESEPHLTAVDQAEWIDGLQREMDNMRTALTWTVQTRHAEMGFRMGAALWRFWQFRGHLEEGRVQMERLVELPEGSAPTKARAMGLDALGSILYWQGDYPRARAKYEEALAIYDRLEDRRGQASIHYNLGYIAGIERDLGQMLHHYGESRALAQEVGDRKLAAYNAMGLSLAYQLTQDYQRAIDVAMETVPILEELGEQWGVANTMGMVGRSLAYRGDYEEARQWVYRCLALMRDLGDVPGIAWVLDDVALVELGEGNVERALILSGAADAAREALGAGAPIQLVQYEDPRPKARALLGDEAVDRAWNTGRTMTVEQIVSFALEGVPAKS